MTDAAPASLLGAVLKPDGRGLTSGPLQLVESSYARASARAETLIVAGIIPNG